MAPPESHWFLPPRLIVEGKHSTLPLLLKCLFARDIHNRQTDTEDFLNGRPRHCKPFLTEVQGVIEEVWPLFSVCLNAEL